MSIGTERKCNSKPLGTLHFKDWGKKEEPETGE